MLGDKEAIATIAVKDIETSRKFYEDTLGLVTASSEEPGVFSYRSGNSSVLVYESKYAGTNKATAVTWVVDDIEGVVGALKEKGVRFEKYDLPGTTRKGEVHFTGKSKAAWFKDPDGNIIAIVQ